MTDILPGYTRISQIIQLYSGYGDIPEHILSAACERGTKVHELIEAILYGIGTPYIQESLRGYIDSFHLWYEKYHDAGFCSHRRWYDAENMITGECDCTVTMDGKRTLIDFKTSAQYNKAWLLQAGAYVYLMGKAGIQIDGISFVKLNKTGSAPAVFPFDIEYAVEMFEKALALHNYFK